MEFSTEIEVRFSDLDAYGHVNNAVFFTYLETARTKLFKDYFSKATAERLFFLVVKAECEYKIPINYSDKVVVSIGVESIGNTSFTFNYKIHNGEYKVFAVAKTVMVTFDANKNKPVRIPESFLKLLTEGCCTA
ncbi:acyl-CoA thioesterase [Deferribacter abyssi]|uniref:acyl-CoA thioesterase n=1 Tax=Deferribacter abyssi TaxID=213806 RepID=UPI003C1C9FC6